MEENEQITTQTVRGKEDDTSQPSFDPYCGKRVQGNRQEDGAVGSRTSGTDRERPHSFVGGALPGGTLKQLLEEREEYLEDVVARIKQYEQEKLKVLAQIEQLKQLQAITIGADSDSKLRQHTTSVKTEEFP